MFAPASSRPPFFTPDAQPRWTPEDLPIRPFASHAVRPPHRSTRATSHHLATADAVFNHHPGSQNSEAVAPSVSRPTSTFCPASARPPSCTSCRCQSTQPPCRLRLRCRLCTSRSWMQRCISRPARSPSSRHRHSLLLRLLLSGLLHLEVHAEPKEEMAFLSNAIAHTSGLFVVSVSARPPPSSGQQRQRLHTQSSATADDRAAVVKRAPTAVEAGRGESASGAQRGSASLSAAQRQQPVLPQPGQPETGLVCAEPAVGRADCAARAACEALRSVLR